ncbi:sporulation histidine kinase inhibitor Sda [Aquisalibacillus elongatus]|uniref:Sporulation inhibitor A n=1 Tax=Aquisalibacillus elongatus TaxID=485577 RepID=A0A3N5CE43_9BACI|nr:sporulation histidine kinase inhibitor Sda [Aquisalibacillus elongatus]RPF55441.1 sporulation inhibitor A [Aquisalibacillus elongatus]
MHHLDNNQLIDAYIKALNLKLEQKFIWLLASELRLRGIDPKSLQYMTG